MVVVVVVVVDGSSSKNVSFEVCLVNISHLCYKQVNIYKHMNKQINNQWFEVLKSIVMDSV